MGKRTIGIWGVIALLLAFTAMPVFSQEIVVTGEKTVRLAVSSASPQPTSEFIKTLRANNALAKIKTSQDQGAVVVQFTIKKGRSLNLVEVEEAARAKGLTVVQEAEVIHEMGPGDHEMRPRQPCSGGMRH